MSQYIDAISFPLYWDNDCYSLTDESKNRGTDGTEQANNNTSCVDLTQ